MIQLIVSIKKAFVYNLTNRPYEQCIQLSLSDFDGDNVNLLGVLLQANIKWIVNVSKNISKSTFMIRRLNLSVTLDVLISVYHAFIQIHLSSFGIIV